MSDGGTIQGKLERASGELLDLSLRNRLLNTPFGQARARNIEIVGRRTADVFEALVKEQKTLGFLPGIGADEKEDGTAAQSESGWLFPPEKSGSDENVGEPQSDEDDLPTRLTPESLQKRLRGLHVDARTFEE
ncbi:MAG TPA: DUF4011 domain-containing protein, partial [Pirellulales bacterium]|nr:DUF4011 domain-containing protein [Pirellulales bacterium]